MEKQMKRLYRSDDGKVLYGVCAGIGEYFNVDPVLVRILWVFSFFAWGFGLVAYLVCCVIIPKKPGESAAKAPVRKPAASVKKPKAAKKRKKK